jgi:hypothetical protein
MKNFDKIIRKYVIGNYYCDPDDDGNREVWEAFEYWDKERIEAEIEIDIACLKMFLVDNKSTIINYLQDSKIKQA